MSESAAILDLHRRRRRTAAAAVVIAVAVGALWMLWAGATWWTGGSSASPIPGTNSQTGIDPRTSGPTSKAPRSSKSALAATALPDETAFLARLWVYPPRPVERLAAKPPEPLAPPPPFKLRLVGLQRGDSQEDIAALVYDPEAFSVTRVARGASIGRYTLEAVDPAKGEAVFADTQYPGKPRHALLLATLAAPKTPLTIVNPPARDGGVP